MNTVPTVNPWRYALQRTWFSIVIAAGVNIGSFLRPDPHYSIVWLAGALLGLTIGEFAIHWAAGMVRARS